MRTRRKQALDQENTSDGTENSQECCTRDRFLQQQQSWGDAAGLHLAVAFAGMSFDETFVKKCERNRIRITPVEYHCIQKGMHADKLLFGYGHLELDEIEKGVCLLQELMQDGCLALEGH